MEILEVLKYTLPALIVFLTAYFLIRAFIRNDQEKRKHEIILQNQKNVLKKQPIIMIQFQVSPAGIQIQMRISLRAYKYLNQ